MVLHASIVRFWHNPHAQDALRRELIHKLDNRDDLFPYGMRQLLRNSSTVKASYTSGGAISWQDVNTYL